MKEYDAIIIGFGKGGKTLATEMASHGMSVAMVEQSDKMYGGTCINIGCIPTKALIHRAKQAAAAADKSFGEKKRIYREAVEFKEGVVTALRDRNYHNLADNPRITIYTGEGSFLSGDTVAVRSAGGTTEIRSHRIFINTGAEPVIPPIEGIGDCKGVYTSTTVMELTELPRRLVIIGGGYIGLEFASMYASFGSDVTVLEGFGELIPREDRDVAQAVKAILERKGVKFRMNARVTSVSELAGVVSVNYTDTLTGRNAAENADAVLLSTGRKPSTGKLNLAAARVDTDQRGAIRVDSHLRTTNPDIYALGDVNGGQQFTYISLDDYRIIREELFGTGSRDTGNRGPVSYSVFIDPPLSRVGMSEEEARSLGLDIRVKTIPVMSIPRVRTIEESEGMLKSVVENGTDKILGCTLLCPESSEIINTVAIAMKAGLDARFLRDFVYTHPSMSESFNDLFS